MEPNIFLFPLAQCLGIWGRLHLRFQRNGEKQDHLRSSSNWRIPGSWDPRAHWVLLSEAHGYCCLRKSPHPQLSAPEPRVASTESQWVKRQGPRVKARVLYWRLHHSPVTTLDHLPLPEQGLAAGVCVCVCVCVHACMCEITSLSSGQLWESHAVPAHWPSAQHALNLVNPRLCCVCVCVCVCACAAHTWGRGKGYSSACTVWAPTAL